MTHKNYKHEIRNTTDFIPYVNNSRTHDKNQINQIASSIKEFGFTNPILIDNDGGIIAGHGRVLAANKLSLDELPCIVLDGLTEAQKKAYIIADNQLPLNAGWDLDSLKLELETLKELDFDLELLGFEDDFLDGLLIEETEGLTDEDAVPEIPDNPISVLGDIWQLGNHRLMCGDSTSIDSVDRLMDGKKADVVFTSPPYNANAKTGDGDIFNNKKSKKMYSEGYSDNLDSQNYIDFASSVIEVCFAFTDGFIFWNVSYNANSKFEYLKQIQNRVEFIVEQVCWKKTGTIPFKGCLMREWEPIYIFSTNKQGLNLKSVQGNFWTIDNQNSQQENHKACFPVELPEKGISLVNNNTGIVFDPFGGAGTTAIACEKLGRNCYMMELDEKYVDVIIKRWQEFTGKEAIHIESGKTYNSMVSDNG